jgi:hypothetical protein
VNTRFLCDVTKEVRAGVADNDGPYYWHIKSGTIQREPPHNDKQPQTPAPQANTQEVRRVTLRDSENVSVFHV